MAKQQHVSSSTTKLVIVGASEGALHVVERLPESMLKDTIVLTGECGQPGGTWRAGYTDKINRLNLNQAVSRSTTRMHCPCPDTTKLERWLSAKHSTIGGETNESSKCDALVKAVEGFVACPRLGALDLFLASRGKRLLRKGVKLLNDKLKSVALVSKEEIPPKVLDTSKSKDSEAAGQPLKYVKLELENDRSLLFAEYVVLADTGTCVGRANIPSFLGRISLASQAVSGVEDQVKIGTWTERIAFAEKDLDITTCDISDKVICIVGGGMTSIHLAEEAMNRLGAKQVFLITKSKMRAKKLEVEVGWMGGKYMRTYLTLSPQERLKSYQESRGKGSISHQAKENLDSLTRNSNFKLMPESMVSTAAWHCDEWKIDLVCANHAEGISIAADYIWVATGTSFDSMSEPIVQNLQRISKAKECGAYPLLSERTLSWPGIPNVMCMGSIAALSLGPSAMLCHGLRTASERITRAILDPSATLHFNPVLDESEPISRSLLCEGEGPSTLSAKSQPKPSLQPLSEIQQRLNTVVSDSNISSKRKHGIENYSWSDSEFDIDIYVKLGFTVEKRNVQVIITSQSVELLVETNDGLYHLKIPKLYKPVQTTKSDYRVLEGKGKIIIHLKKTDNHEWKFLKG